MDSWALAAITAIVTVQVRPGISCEDQSLLHWNGLCARSFRVQWSYITSSLTEPVLNMHFAWNRMSACSKAVQFHPPFPSGIATICRVVVKIGEKSWAELKCLLTVFSSAPKCWFCEMCVGPHTPTAYSTCPPHSGEFGVRIHEALSYCRRLGYAATCQLRR